MGGGRQGRGCRAGRNSRRHWGTMWTMSTDRRRRGWRVDKDEWRKKNKEKGEKKEKKRKGNIDILQSQCNR